jgi:predicted RND superfamily exporter protein
MVRGINEQIKKSNLPDNKIVELNKRIGKDSISIKQKDAKILELQSENSGLEKEKDNAAEKYNTIKNQQTALLENQINLVLKKGTSNDPEMLKGLKKMAEDLNPNSENKLLSLISICDSFTAIRKVFEVPYDVDLVKNAKLRYKALVSKTQSEGLSSFLTDDLDKLIKNLDDYCDYTNELYKVFARAYPLRNDDKSVANAGSKKNAFRNELNKAYYYVVNYTHLKTLLNDFLKNESVRDEYQNKKPITCN